MRSLSPHHLITRLGDRKGPVGIGGEVIGADPVAVGVDERHELGAVARVVGIGEADERRAMGESQ